MSHTSGKLYSICYRNFIANSETRQVQTPFFPAASGTNYPLAQRNGCYVDGEPTRCYLQPMCSRAHLPIQHDLQTSNGDVKDIAISRLCQGCSTP